MAGVKSYFLTISLGIGIKETPIATAEPIMDSTKRSEPFKKGLISGFTEETNKTTETDTDVILTLSGIWAI